MNKLTFKSGNYFLRKKNDFSCGDSGGELVSIDPDTLQPAGENGEVKVGCRVRCGSIYARSYQKQDWWMTSTVNKIVKVENGWAIIETNNSVYVVGDTSKYQEALSTLRKTKC